MGLSDADAYCRHLLQGHYENFWVSSPLVPKRLRPDMARIYAYCRTVDDLGDESTGPEDAEARLGVWRQDVERMLAGGTPAHPVLIALAETVRARDLPAAPFLDLIEANVRDQHVTAYEDWPALEDYCMHSAAPVGRLVLHVFGQARGALIEASDDVCNGLQLANFAQDVAVDREKGRTYLLQSDIAEHGVHGAVRAMCERAAGLLSSGHRLEAAVDSRRLRVQLALYRLGGEAILRAIARAGYRTDEVRPTVPMSAKVRLMVGALAARRHRGDAGGGRRELGRPGAVDRVEPTSIAGNAAEPLDREAQEVRPEMRCLGGPDPAAPVGVPPERRCR